MKKQVKVKEIQKILDKKYPNPPVPLNHKDPFTLLIAVLLSARCTDKKVNEVTPYLFKLANNPKEMAKQNIKKVREIVKPCGLSPQKSKAIVGLSKILVNKYDSVVPKNFVQLEELPGVGHKTASVVMSQAFGVPAFPVDTHIHRLAARWGLSDGKNVVKTEKDLKAVFAEETWNRRHLQIIYFGREYCPALRHDLSSCPICSWAATKKRIREEMGG